MPEHNESELPIKTTYLNTDFDLKSSKPFDNLHQELAQKCCELHYTIGGDNQCSASYEADQLNSNVTNDIFAILNAIRSLSSQAQSELDACSLREFNIGFDCGDCWGYVYSIPPEVVAAVAEASCSLAVTLYPMRNKDGSPKL